MVRDISEQSIYSKYMLKFIHLKTYKEHNSIAGTLKLWATLQRQDDSP